MTLSNNISSCEILHQSGRVGNLCIVSPGIGAFDLECVNKSLQERP